MSDKASEMFWDSFTIAGSICIECACGRTHFSRQEDAGTWEEGELEGLLQKEQEKPDRYIGTDDDSVATASIQGVPICYGCPCGTAAKYERFIIDNESEIIEYLKAKSEAKRKEADATASHLASLVGSLPHRRTVLDATKMCRPGDEPLA